MIHRSAVLVFAIGLIGVAVAQYGPRAQPISARVIPSTSSSIVYGAVPHAQPRAQPLPEAVTTYPTFAPMFTYPTSTPPPVPSTYSQASQQYQSVAAASGGAALPSANTSQSGVRAPDDWYLRNFGFAEGTPYLPCGYGMPPPTYNNPHKKCVPWHPMCGWWFSCIMDV